MIFRLFNYFNRNKDLSIYERQKSNSFVILNLIALLFISVLFLVNIFNYDVNSKITISSLISFMAVMSIGLYFHKKKGLKVAGNIFSLLAVVSIAIFINFLSPGISALYKYVQGFYTALLLLSLCVIFASRRILLINSVIICISAIHVYIYAIHSEPALHKLITRGIVQYIMSVIGITSISYFAIKFSENAIMAANEDARIKEIQNQELISSEEEIRATNEELIATTEALQQSFDELSLAKSKVEESMRLKTLFLTNISHEVRTPMNGIMGFSKLINIPDLSEDTRQKYSDIIVSSSEQLLKIIDNILEVSVKEAENTHLELSEINLNQFISNILDVFKLKSEKKGIQLNSEFALLDAQSNIIIDQTRLYKALSNLIENAIKFTNEGQVVVGYKLKDRKLKFHVQDTGIGIDLNKTWNIFDRFVQEDETVTTKFGGLGLGLSIAKENIELLGGEINVHSAKNKGSVFSFEVLYTPSNILDVNILHDIHEEDKELIKNSKIFTILIAEDEEVNFYYLNELIKLIDSRISILHVRNGQEAIYACENQKINLILMDLKMPVLNGIEATIEIKKINPDITIIAQTAFSSTEEKNNALDAGCDAFITKPIKYDQLEPLLKKYLYV